MFISDSFIDHINENFKNIAFVEGLWNRFHTGASKQSTT